MKDLKHILEMLVKNTLTQLFVFGLISFIASAFASSYDIAYFVMIGAAIPVVVIVVIYIAYAWVIAFKKIFEWLRSL